MNCPPSRHRWRAERNRRWQLLVLLWLLTATTAALFGDTPVFQDGRILLPVLVAPEADPKERMAADELARALHIMSGLTWTVRPATSPEERGFHVGWSGHMAGPGPALNVAHDLFAPSEGEIGPDGFRIQTQLGSVFIEGATPEASTFAVSWFLQHEAGVRWYAPGVDGEVIPRRTQWSLPGLQVLRQPAYVSRELTGLQRPAELEWARRNGLRGRLEFSHALNRLYTPKILSAHPHWRPLLRGEYYQPTSTEDYNWQPNLGRPELADYAATRAAAAFDRDPGRASFSLGINDSVRFDQSASTRALVEPLRYFRGRPDYSPLVFAFMNRAAATLARPGRYLGCLAYFWCENAPVFRVNPQVVPYLTADRTQYYNHQYKDEDLALMTRWGSSGVRAFGLWDYAYGGGYLVPREPVAALATAVREGWRRGARGYLAELEPHWGFDAFKAWMLTQLLWEPDRPVADLADDFYRGYYGAAAEPMWRFFVGCEAQWTSQKGSPYWIKYYKQEDQALLFPPAICRELRALIDAALQAASSDAVVERRIQQTSRAFHVTETYVAFDAARRKIAAAADPSLKEAAGLIRDLADAEAGFAEAFGRARAGDEPAMAGMETESFLRNDPVPALLWRVARVDATAAQQTLDQAGELAGGNRTWRAMADALAAREEGLRPNLVANDSFQGVRSQQPRFLYPRSGDMPDRWTVAAVPTEWGRVAAIDKKEHGRRVLRVEGEWDAMIFQWIPAQPGHTYAVTARFRGRSSAGNESALFLRFLSRNDAVLETVAMQSLPTGLTSEWRVMALAEVAPANAAWVGVGIGATRQSADDWLEAASVDLEDGVAGGEP